LADRKIWAGLIGEADSSISGLVASSIGVRRVRFPAEVIVVAVRWYLRYGGPTAMSRSCSPNAGSTSTT